MSQIFDALQRSESESAGNDSVASSNGPELLQHAERRVVSKWHAASVSEISDATSGNDELITLPQVGNGHGAEMAAPAVPDILSKEERDGFLSRIRSVPISLGTESRLVCLTDRESPTAEAMRLLSVRLRGLRRERLLKRVLITSTIPREGKSTISANLACALAHEGEKRTLLIGGDIRIPAFPAMFGVESLPGLGEMILEERNLSDSIYRLESAGIWILPAGSIPSNPLQVLQSARLPRVMDQLSSFFDWIIIDSPPVLPVADTTIWMRLSDGILLVTRQGATEKRQLQRGLEALDSQKVLGALLNCASGAAYGSYYYRSSTDS